MSSKTESGEEEEPNGGKDYEEDIFQQDGIDPTESLTFFRRSKVPLVERGQDSDKGGEGEERADTAEELETKRFKTERSTSFELFLQIQHPLLGATSLLGACRARVSAAFCACRPRWLDACCMQ